MGNYSEYPTDAGIYKITCKNNNKIYIGKAINLRNRINNHKNVKRQSKGMFYFQYALLKYGWESFTVEILETVKDFDKIKDNASLLEREAFYIELFDSTNSEKGYNRCKFSTDNTGIPCSEETKIKIGLSNRGKIRSKETIEKSRQSRLGRKHSEESKEKMSKSRLGNSNRKGKPHSDETKQKMRKTRLGRKHSEESKEKMRKPKSEEAKKNMGKSFLGRKHSEESKEKMRKAKRKETKKYGKKQ
jgi:group I intron endonuclease